MDALEIESRLWAYIDGMADSAEQSAIEKLLQENLEWKAKYAELLELHSTLQKTELEQPSMRFTKNIMEEIAKYQIAPGAKEYINKKIIWSIAAFFVIVMLSFLVYGFSQVNWSAGSSNNTFGIDLTKVDYTKMFSNTYMNFFMMLNVVLGLLFLDRYLANKRNKLLEEA